MRLVLFALCKMGEAVGCGARRLQEILDKARNTLNTTRFQAANSDLIAAGAALHWLKPREKRPIADGWSTAPRASETDLATSYVAAANIGIRLDEPSKTGAGYIHLVDLDIRKPEASAEAWAKVAEILPNHAELPTVISGSGAGRHFYFFAPEAMTSRKLAKGDGWEIELFGTGKQAALPPSIHPSTGKAYRWSREIDTTMIGLGVGPAAPIAPVDPAPATTIGDDLTALLSEDDDLLADHSDAKWAGDLPRIRSALKAIPADDRDTWLKVGMALHHASAGSDDGFEIWDEWSRTWPDKYAKKDDPKRTWCGFGKNRRVQPVRLGSCSK
ncbi:MAG: bifunctional DNA primase/polymerase [Defluviimonas sp.]|nr:bifunctional DNA primase/polymerase [Defluviimonas sp.]